MTTELPPYPPFAAGLIGPALDDRFPDLVLPDQRGQSVDLHAVRAGRKALVLFYRSASW